VQSFSTMIILLISCYIVIFAKIKDFQITHISHVLILNATNTCMPPSPNTPGPVVFPTNRCSFQLAHFYHLFHPMYYINTNIILLSNPTSASSLYSTNSSQCFFTIRDICYASRSSCWPFLCQLRISAQLITEGSIRCAIFTVMWKFDLPRIHGPYALSN
jgi:hypothetical protein